MICASLRAPSVAVTSACVSPRVKSAEPWVRRQELHAAAHRADLVERAPVESLLLSKEAFAEEPLLQLAECHRGMLALLAFLGVALDNLGFERVESAGCARSCPES